MHKIFSIMIAATVVSSCGSSKHTTMSHAANTLSANEAKDGWQLLFDGKSTAGWHGYGKQGVGAAWKVEDGTLHFDAVAKNTQNIEGGNIVTNNDYGDFDLKYEWRISPNGNSGVMFYVKEDAAKYPEPWQTGPEMQVLDNDGHPDGKLIKHRAGDLYDLISVSKETVRPVGQWNEVEVVSKNGVFDFHLNGEHVLHTTMWNDAWRNMIANSKFKAYPDFGTFKSGKIALQDHGNDVWFRNIKIKSL